MSGSHRIVACIVAFRDAAAIDRCLSSLEESRKASGRHAQIDIVIFDNSAEEPSMSAIRTMSLGRAKYVASPANVGYAGAGYSLFRSMFSEGIEGVILVNQDLVVDANFFDVAFSAMQEGAVIRGPYVHDISPPNELMYVGGRLRWPWLHIQLEKDPQRVDYVNGSTFLVTKSAFDQVGNFDPEYVMYFEETDYCYRARKLGVSVGSMPARVFHERGRRGVHYVYWMTRNRIRFLRKHGHPAQVIPAFLYIVCWTLPVLLFRYRSSVGKALSGFGEGVAWNFRDAKLSGFWIHSNKNRL